VDEWNLQGLADDLSFMLMTPVAVRDLEGRGVEALEEQAVAIAERAYQAREAEFSPQVLRELERHLYLFTVDEHWRDHLYELDHLKGGIGLRAFGQRDPLIEYKKEAFTLFETLVRDTREEFVQRLFRVQLAPEAMREIDRPARPPRTIESHAAAGSFGGRTTPPALAPSAARPASSTPAPARAAPRVGRNDPCPCGSGKKYKKCHMPIDEGVQAGS
jgi:preprotein translocase subunit SecA